MQDSSEQEVRLVHAEAELTPHTPRYPSCSREAQLLRATRGCSVAWAAGLIAALLCITGAWWTSRPARASQDENTMLASVFDPGHLEYFHCSTKEMNVPMQILNRAKGKDGPWDIDFLDVKTGEYKRVAQLPKIRHEGIFAERLNACAMNPMDDYIYCVVQIVPEQKPKNFATYIVRVGVVDYEQKLAGLHFVAKVRKGGHYSGAFDMDGTFYFGPGQFHYVEKLHLIKGTSFWNRHQAADKTKLPRFSVNRHCKGADYAFWEQEVNGETKKILWTLKDHKLAAIDLTGLVESESKQAPCKVYQAVGLPDDVKGHFGAGWTFKKPDGSHVVYFANNKGKGVYGLDHKTLDLDAKQVHLYKAGDSQATSQNDGANCMALSRESPFKATPPPHPVTRHADAPKLAGDAPKPAADAPVPPAHDTPTPDDELPPHEPPADEPEPTTQEPTPAPPEDTTPPVKKLYYEWVLMGDNTVCRRDHRDPIIWPKNLRLQTATVAHHCEVPPCKTIPKSIPLGLKECQERCLTYEKCRAVEYRHSESRCEILARPTQWFIDNTKHRTVPGPLDFECWLYKPSCDLLLKLRDHGADSPSFDWAWSVCFPNNR